jgi:Tfp pilus assembly protein PilE
LKSEKGITLVTLAVTIIIMLIIASVTITAGMDSVKNSKKTAYITELEMIQEKVNTIYEKRKLNEEDIENYNSAGRDISNADQTVLNKVLKNISTERI